MPSLCFFDLETRSPVNIKKEGLWRYATHPETEILCVSMLFRGGPDDGLSGVWAPPERRFPGARIDDRLVVAWNQHVNEGGFVVAWNAQFDRLVLQEVARRRGLNDPGLPLMHPLIEQTLCAQAQAESYSLPGKLAKAAEALRVPVQKDRRGPMLLARFSNTARPWRPEDPNFATDLADLWTYAMKDTIAMSQVWDRCRPWAGPEWEDYHVVERMNERGILCDIDFAEAATSFSAAEMESINRDLEAVTGIEGITIRKSLAKTAFLWDLLQGTELQEMMLVPTVRKRKRVIAKSAGKGVQQAIRDRLEDFDESGKEEVLGYAKRESLRAFLDVLDRGNSSASAKFAKMVGTHVDGRLRHQFRCSPTITGRHAGRGVGFDNLFRTALEPGLLGMHQSDPALDAIDCITGVEPYDTLSIEERVALLEQFYQLPFARILARLVRPALVAPEGQYLVWGDWNAIEPRVLAWLAESEVAIRPWREGEDPYCQQAIALYELKCTWQELRKRAKAGDPEASFQRLIGKITILALGYQGGAGALMGMARNYGVRLREREAERFKERFRASNPWLLRFWKKLEDALWGVVNGPHGTAARVGRIKYRRVGRDVWCLLPDGRPIVYPDVRVEEKYKERFDAVVTTVTYRKRWGDSVVRGELYGGILCENATQGTAASLLRHGMRTVDARGLQLLAPRHDEMMLETQPGDDPADVAAELKRLMEEVPPWAEGLPVAAEVAHGVYYGK